MTDTIQQPITAVTIPTGLARPRLALCTNPSEGLVGPMLVMGVESQPNNWLALRPTSEYGPIERRVRHHSIPDEHMEYLRWLDSHFGEERVSGQWVHRSIVTIIGDLTDHDMHRIFEDGGVTWALAQVPHMLAEATAEMEERVIEGLRDQQEEQDWCDELEDWIERMGLERGAGKRGPRYMTFEVDVEFTATATIQTSRTITIETDGEDIEYLRERAVEQAEEQVRNDLKGSVDFGQYEYIEAGVDYSEEGSNIDCEYTSDEDGQEV